MAAVIGMLADRAPGLLRVLCEADFDYVLLDGTQAECANRALSAARAPVERGVARLKSWRIFRTARYSPNRMTSIAAAVLTWERQR